MMPNTPLNVLYNLWRYNQHLILESEYEYDDDEFDNPLDEHNWLLQTRGKYVKFVFIIPQMLQNQDNLPIRS